jgi:hypothetical protein
MTSKFSVACFNLDPDRVMGNDFKKVRKMYHTR